MNSSESPTPYNERLVVNADELLLLSRLEKIKAETERRKLWLEVLKQSPNTLPDEISSYEQSIEADEWVINRLEKLSREFDEEVESLED